LLVAGLSDNQSLKVLRFFRCMMDAAGVIEILHILLVNRTLQDLAFDDINITGSIDVSSGKTLMQVFRGNKSVVSLKVPPVDLRSGALAESLSGLQENKTLRKLILDGCRLDNEGMTCLVQTMQSPNIGLNEIGLPIHYVDEVDEIQEGRLAFLRNLVHMPTIQKVHFGRSLSDLDNESQEILLRAVKENKKIHLFDKFLASKNDGEEEEDDDVSAAAAAAISENASLVVREIQYFLKLNRYGRRIFDSPNVTASLWPRILSPVANKTEGDSDALFFFLCQYFSRQGKSEDDSLLNRQQEPLWKKVRVD
jgi:hypothetical protein